MNQWLIKIKENSLKIAAILIVSLVFSLWVYHFNIYPGMRRANKQHIVFERDQPGEGKKINISQTFTQGFSFFIEVKTKYRPGKNYHHTLLDQAEEKIRFMLTEHGDLGMYWGSDEVYCRKNTIKFHRTSIKKDIWNEIGFIYTVANSRGILTTYINGKVLWKKYLPGKNPFISFITLLPVKHDNKIGGTFIGEAQNALFLKRALSSQEVNKYYFNKSRKTETKGLSLKVFILFIMCNLLLNLFLTFLKKIFTLVKRESPARTNEGVYKLGFLFGLNVLCFVLFNLGNIAARYLHSIPGFSDEGIYLFVLNLLFFTVLFTIFLEKATGAEMNRCILLTVTILMVLAFTWLVCSLPRFEDISPFNFNVLFALLFTLIAGSFEILQLTGREEMGQ